MPSRPKKYETGQDDPIRAICRAMFRDLGVPRDKVLRFELAMRDEYGGRKHYVKQAPLRVVIERDPRGHHTRSW